MKKTKLVSIRLYHKSLEIFSEPRDDKEFPVHVWAELNGKLKGGHYVASQDRASLWAREYLKAHLERLMCGWSQGANG